MTPCIGYYTDNTEFTRQAISDNLDKFNGSERDRVIKISNMGRLIKSVAAEKNGQRIDNFLFTSLKGVPKSLVYRLLRTGKIRVNGRRVKQTYRLQTDDKILIPEIRRARIPTEKKGVSGYVRVRIESSILYEDESLLVLNKPAGLAVHSGTLITYGIIEALRALRPATPYLELGHRLDRETSGCLLIAKNKNMLDELHEVLRTRKIQKRYLALVKGKWDLGKKTVNIPLRNKISPYEAVQGDSQNSKIAVTEFVPDKVYGRFSLMHVRPSTGRTHQIRIHASRMGYPIAGDQKYGDYIFNRRCRKMGLRRMFLHASNVSFQCPKNSKKYNIVAPLTADLKDFLEMLESSG